MKGLLVTETLAKTASPVDVSEVEHRFYYQLIVGKQKQEDMLDGMDADVEADAFKLDIEREAVFDRLEKKKEARRVFEDVSGQLVYTLIQSIMFRLDDPLEILKHAGLTSKQLSLMELLQGDNAELPKLRPYIEKMDWLSKELVNMVNSPSFRHRKPQRASDIRVKDLKLVLNFIGIENLQVLVPYLCIRTWLPTGRANMLWTTRKLWRYMLVTATASQILAKEEGIDGAFVYTCSLLSQLGTSAILSNSSMIFDGIWGHWLREANQSRDKEIYDAVIATEFPAEAVYQQVLDRAMSLNWELLSLLEFEESQFTQVLKELAETHTYAGLSPQAAVIARASCFAKVMLLKEMRQISDEEKHAMYQQYELSTAELALLNQQNFRKLEIM
ncbi:HDOD domain-containing protein [Shewanella sp. NIFS-20-20]|uniref:HDOD domain-containing protein n=1 Tax=Shewanella sp. NIFS-20-20 TaxID=2853806 RepID=UPI001C447371|nr:HDOD domain-containing protein [Shewanella sp. NIFS-20-20]